jgi:ArsR family transcriptional regulator
LIRRRPQATCLIAPPKPIAQVVVRCGSFLSFQSHRDPKIYELQADICKIFSNAKRLEIINALKEKEMSASELIEKTGLSKANLSQHMSIFKSKGVILTRREGVNIYYRISSPKLIQACNLMREVLLDQFQEKGKIVSSLRHIK